MPRIDLLQIRSGTAAAWTTANPVLAAAEPGLETDTRKVKYGDGVTAWNALAYSTVPTIEHYIGDWAGSAYPDTGDGGNYTAGAPAQGDRWRLTGTIGIYGPGTVIEAAINGPGQTAGNWIKYAVQP